MRKPQKKAAPQSTVAQRHKAKQPCKYPNNSNIKLIGQPPLPFFLYVTKEWKPGLPVKLPHEGFCRSIPKGVATWARHIG
jgi:hypothetical protein